LVSGQPVVGDAAAASWGIIFQLTRFALIQPCNKTSNQKRSNLKTVCEKATRHFLATYKTLFVLYRINLTGGRRQQAGDRRQEAGDRRQETGDRRQAEGGRRQEAGDSRPETAGRRLQAGGRRHEAGGRRQEAGGPNCIFIREKYIYICAEEGRMK
jgi:hypothetical protein